MPRFDQHEARPSAHLSPFFDRFGLPGDLTACRTRYRESVEGFSASDGCVGVRGEEPTPTFDALQVALAAIAEGE